MSITKVNKNIIKAVFKGNPKTVIVSCHAPTNLSTVEETEEFYEQLGHVIEDIPKHAMLLVGGDMNAHLSQGYSYHKRENRNGGYLQDFLSQHNLIAGNTTFQKNRKKLWTWRSPSGSLSQIDFCMYRKRWRNSILDCQAYSSSNPIGSDHKMVSTKVKLSLRTTKATPRNRLNWAAILSDQTLANQIDDAIISEFNSTNPTNQTYSTFSAIATAVGKRMLPPKQHCPPKSVDNISLISKRKATVQTKITNIQSAQSRLREAFNTLETERINKTLKKFESSNTASDVKSAWKLVKELSGKTKNVVYIQGEDSLGQWKNHFKDLLNAEPVPTTDSSPITPIFERSLEIQQGDFTQAEVNTAVHQMKIGMPGLDDLPSEFWKLPKIKKQLRKFCNQAYNGNRPKEWGEAALVPIPKKGDLTKCSNYRGIALSQVSSKIYNRLLLNRIRPVVDKLL